MAVHIPAAEPAALPQVGLETVVVIKAPHRVGLEGIKAIGLVPENQQNPQETAVGRSK